MGASERILVLAERSLLAAGLAMVGWFFFVFGEA
jgi:hypothetical protein